MALAVDTAKESVPLLSAEVNGIREAAVFMQAMCNLAMPTKTLIEHDRKAYNINSEPERPQNELATFLANISARSSRLLIAGLS